MMQWLRQRCQSCERRPLNISLRQRNRALMEELIREQFYNAKASVPCSSRFDSQVRVSGGDFHVKDVAIPYREAQKDVSTYP